LKIKEKYATVPLLTDLPKWKEIPAVSVK